MKAKTFENLIRKIVREEIDYALRREIKSLKEDLREDIKPIIQEQPTQQYTSNNALNDLLNETAQGDTNLDGNRSPVSMEGDFSTIGGVPAEAAPKEVVDAVTRDYSSLMEAINKKKNK